MFARAVQLAGHSTLRTLDCDALKVDLSLQGTGQSSCKLGLDASRNMVNLGTRRVTFLWKADVSSGGSPAALLRLTP